MRFLRSVVDAVKRDQKEQNNEEMVQGESGVSVHNTVTWCHKSRPGSYLY